MGHDARLNHDELLQVQQAAISAQLGASRSGLLVGLPVAFIASLPHVAVPAEQILTDLGVMNDAGVLTDGTLPLVVWLKNAITMTVTRREVSVFQRALDQVLRVRGVQPEREGSDGVTSELAFAQDEFGAAPMDLIGKPLTTGWMYGQSDGTEGPRLESSADDIGMFSSPFERPTSGAPLVYAPELSTDDSANFARMLTNITAVSECLTERRYGRVLKHTPPELLEKWIEEIKRLPFAPHDNRAVASIFVTMWKHARILGKVPYVHALDGRLSLEGIAQLYAEKRSSWRCITGQQWQNVGPRVRAREAEFDWADGAWERGYTLAGPLLELIYEVSRTQGKTFTDKFELQWWNAAGGVLGEKSQVVFPWPTIDLSTFSEYEKMAVYWNREYSLAIQFHEHIPEDESVADQLAYSFVQAHHILWHTSAESGWLWGNLHWKGLVDHLFRDVRSSSQDSHFSVKWIRALPLLAAPESGLSRNAAAGILDGTNLDDSLRRELRDLRIKRARACLGGKDAEEVLVALTAEQSDHPWVQQIERSK